MNRFRLALLIACLAGRLGADSRAAVFQYAATEKGADGKDVTALLWVPPEADRIRGVLVGGLTLMEEHFSQDPVVRRACAEEKLAIVYFSPALDSKFDYKATDAAQRLQKSLDDLATASGYREIADAPLFPYGHSVGTLFASHVVCWQPDRCFGALLFKGGISTGPGDPAAALVGVPILAVKGQFEEFGPGPSGVLRDFEDRETAWKGMHDLTLRLRGQGERNLIGLAVEPGATHFAWPPRPAPLVADFIRASARLRIPEAPAEAGQPVRCRPVRPEDGALADGEVGRPAAPAAPYAQFTGDRRRAFWFPDVSLARAVEAFETGMFDRKPQFVTFADPKTGGPLFVGHDLRLRLSPDWVGPDSFRVAGTFLDHAPDKYPRVQGPVGHASGPVRFRAFCGAVEQTGPDTFRVSPDGRGRLRADLLAYDDGDATYRYAEQQGRVSLPDRLTAGRTQSITFAPPGEMSPGGAGLGLSASSDAGLQVRFAVASGPAVIEAGVLKPAQVPARAVFPLVVTVVAYQYGSAVEPFVRTAEPVVRTVMIRK